MAEVERLITGLAAIGDITRFPAAKKLVGYAGLGVRLYQSGQNVYTGRITKAGRRELRWAMIEAAWVAVEHHPHGQAEFQRLVPRLGDKKAIVAIARKLLVVVWHVLTKGVADRHAQPDAVARKLYAFAETLGRAGRRGQTTAAFTRAALDRLELGRDLATIQRSRTRQVVLPPSALATPSPG